MRSQNLGPGGEDLYFFFLNLTPAAASICDRALAVGMAVQKQKE